VSASVALLEREQDKNFPLSCVQKPARAFPKSVPGRWNTQPPLITVSERIAKPGVRFATRRPLTVIGP